VNSFSATYSDKPSDEGSICDVQSGLTINLYGWFRWVNFGRISTTNPHEA